MQTRLLVYRVLATVVAFLLALNLLRWAGASGYWSLAGAIFCGLVAGQAVQRWWDRRR
jgi:hypothetical protein